MVSIGVVVCFAVVAVAAATDVKQCAGKNIPDLSQNVQLIPCNKIPCKLKKGTDQHITIAFTPEKDVQTIKNHVTAQVLEVNLPFVGVDGKSICDKIYTEDGAAAGCPLTAGTKYMYKDSFPVLAFYPSIKVKVHWELLDDKHDVTCFEVDARIA
ncbi:unnamed protein product [Arctia plantaginis]|uniref:MD-2-related lipid-recognition domain-containing protein n=1 Tax=Arctia plantaginis TaxID=874455 RepID=A0A8S1AK72_ARCPL|nr:unnamed protein product [Arctia plantaginis]CAB3249213.1 unnamed protein product [Arctia plantaginis]